MTHNPSHPLAAEGASVTLGGQYLVRPSRPSDLPALQQLFACARRFMAQSGNPTQWVNGYPADDILLADIATGTSYAVEQHGRLVATFVLRPGADPTYAVIYDGDWPSSAPYATIHRVASNGEVHGIMQLVLRYAMHRHHTLRIDTHRDNTSCATSSSKPASAIVASSTRRQAANASPISMTSPDMSRKTFGAVSRAP